jgi:hypothetical protein
MRTDAAWTLALTTLALAILAVSSMLLSARSAPPPTQLVLVETQEVSRGDCVIRKQPAPDPRDSNPHVYDVFAADELTHVYFVAQRYFGRCNAPEEHSDPRNRAFLGNVFVCRYSVPSRPGLEHYVYSRRLYSKDSYESTIIIQCPLPEDLRIFADNRLNRAELNVTLIPTHNPVPESDVFPLQNLPVCANPVVNEGVVMKLKKKHFLAACVWTKGDTYVRIDRTTLQRTNISDVLPRLEEWLEFHLMVGFEHFYFYDNSEAKHSDLWLALQPYVRAGVVTYIYWPAKVCGRHRSSQYAAENSCIRRFADSNEWMAHFDVDEFMTPTGKYDSVVDILKDKGRDGTIDAIAFNDYVYGSCPGKARSTSLYMERMSCFTGQKVNFKRKEIIRPHRILYHWVHYSHHTFSGKKAKWVMLDASTEGKLVHLRHGSVSRYEQDENDDVLTKWIPRLKDRLQSIHSFNH